MLVFVVTHHYCARVDTLPLQLMPSLRSPSSEGLCVFGVMVMEHMYSLILCLLLALHLALAQPFDRFWRCMLVLLCAGILSGRKYFLFPNESLGQLPSRFWLLQSFKVAIVIDDRHQCAGSNMEVLWKPNDALQVIYRAFLQSVRCG